VAEIVLGRSLEGRDCLAESGAAEGANSSPVQARQTTAEKADLAQERARPQALKQQLPMPGAGGLRLGAPVLADRLAVRLAAPDHQKLLAPKGKPQSMVSAASVMLLLLIGGGAGYAIFSPSRYLDKVASQAAAFALGHATSPATRASVEPTKDRARVVEEASRRNAALKPQAEEQRLADEAADRERLQREQAAAKAAEEEARRSAEPREADLRMTYRDRQKLQVALTSLSFDVGGIDGTFGLRTRQMIAAWQTKNGDISTGFFTAPQKKALLSEGASAIAKWEDEQRRAYAEEQRRLQQQQPPPQPPPSLRRSGWTRPEQ